jgi:pSer/pThr/pTyr-binding forkhead associated (FHA) protein
MPRLLIKTPEYGNHAVPLKLGANRFGRSPQCDFPIRHETVSGLHCEITITGEGLLVRDCGSTNGTYIDNQPVSEAILQAGQVLRLGDVEIVVESAEVVVAVPHIERPIPAPPVVTKEGGMICRRHPGALVTHQCTNCREVLCDACVTRLRRRGGHVLRLCPLCSHRCEQIGGTGPRKRNFFEFLQKTVKLPFRRITPDSE